MNFLSSMMGSSSGQTSESTGNGVTNCEGWIQKKGRSFVPSWQKRYLVLYDTKLEYYLDESKSTKGKKGDYVISKDTTVAVDENSLRFTINGSSGEFVIEAPDSTSQMMWSSSILQVVERVRFNAPFIEDSKQSTSLAKYNEQRVEVRPAAERKACAKEGWVEKLGHKVPTWKRRYLVLEGSILSYYTDSNYNDKKGEFILLGNCAIHDDSNPLQFTIKGAGTSFSVKLVDYETKADWVAAIDSAIDLTCQGRRTINDTDDSVGKPAENFYTGEDIRNNSKEGWIEKLGSNVANWKRRYLVLKKDRLKYYTDSDCVQQKGEFIILHNSEVTVDSQASANFQFTVTSDAASFSVRCSEKTSLRSWMLAITSEIDELYAQKTGVLRGDDISAVDSKSGSTRPDAGRAVDISRGRIDFQGWVQKLGRQMPYSWKRRYMILSSKRIEYFIDDTFQEKKGEYNIQGNSIVDESGQKYGIKNDLVFTVCHPEDSLTLQAEDEDSKKKWIAAIDRAIDVSTLHQGFMANQTEAVHAEDKVDAADVLNSFGYGGERFKSLNVSGNQTETAVDSRRAVSEESDKTERGLATRGKMKAQPEIAASAIDGASTAEKKASSGKKKGSRTSTIRLGSKVNKPQNVIAFDEFS